MAACPSNSSAPQLVIKNYLLIGCRAKAQPKIAQNSFCNDRAGIVKAATTIKGPRQLGRIWRNMMRISLAPIQRAASTNSFCFKESTWPRTRRATPTQFTMARCHKEQEQSIHQLTDERVSRRATITMIKNNRSGKA